jgi:hypothetical protein
MDNFYELESDETFVYVSSYPYGRVPLVEFDIKPFCTKNLQKHFEGNQSFLTLLKKIIQDSYCAKGNHFCITMKEYDDYQMGQKTGKLERVGDAIFNRAPRHTVPIPRTYTREEFEQNPSFPAPIGVRAEDFAFPSEQNEIFTELLTQIFNCNNAPECPEAIRAQYGLDIHPNSHMCEWCGDVMDIVYLNQEYCSKEHSVNFCHRDPFLGTKKGNVYIGHCSCNREQGGYSEEQRIQQIIRLAKYNSAYKDIILNALK